jgi:hypothetical protein
LKDTNKSLEDFAIGKKLKILIEKLKSKNNILKIQSPLVESSFVNKMDIEFHANNKMIEYIEMLLSEINK